jgi:Carboxypeptidase regulatory-like domain
LRRYNQKQTKYINQTPNFMSKNSIFIGKVTAFFLVLVLSFSSFAQVTSSAISGVISDVKGDGLPGATVIAVHTPSGTKYGAISDVNGRYVFPSVRVGGPYKVTVTYVGFKDQSKEGIIADLGSNANINLKLKEDNATLDEVVVSANKSDIFSSSRTGASVSFGKETVNSVPTINRTLNSITKYNAYSNGNSFAGQDSRLNNITIDGSVFNNGFGLGNDASAGGRTSTSAISIDAIEQVQINIAPYDVRQSGFAGAGINAVTRSGNNDFQGSVYYFNQNDGLVGKKANGIDLPKPKFSENSFGFRLGGPILQNKLFFFVNAEFLDRNKPALDWVAARPSALGSVSRTQASDLEDLGVFMKDKFNYNIGAIDQFNNDVSSKKFLTRLDYNVDDKNKLTLRYSQHDSEADALISGSNSGNTAGFGNRTNSALALSPQNTGYKIQDNTRSIVAELNSTISSKVANNVIITYNKQIEDRSYRTQQFPTVEIRKDGSTYTTIGFDPFTPNNKLNYSTFNITDNVTYFKGRHTYTFGAGYERFKSANLFFYASNGVWSFNSIDDFKKAATDYLANPTINPGVTKSSVPIASFDYRYSLVNGGEPPFQNLMVNTTSFYGQDDIQVNDRLKISLGLRGDYLAVPTKGFANSVVENLKYQNLDGSDVKINTQNLPKSRLYWSPRVGFNLDLHGDKTTQIRGGSGMFLSRMPYVLLSNQIGNNGVIIAGLHPRVATTTVNYPFTLDPTVYRPTNTDPAKITGYNVDVSDPNLKFPQIWKTNLAIDQKLPFGIIGTLEGIYNDNVNALRYIDVNLKPASSFYSGLDNRPRFPTTQGGTRYTNPQMNGARTLTNTSQGYSYTLTAKLEKPLTGKNLGGMLGYTYGKAKDIASVASTVDLNTASVNGLNQLDLAYANNDVRNRFVGYVSKRFSYGGEFGGSTMLTLAGTSQSGYKVSYIFANDVNGDGINNDLLYVYAKGADIKFAPVTGTYKDAAGATVAYTFSPAQQQEAYDKLIDGNPYLKTRKGQYAERNGGYAPWYTRLDFTAVQDVYMKIQGKKQTLSFRMDVSNFGNLLNNKNGVGYSTTGQLLSLASGANLADGTYRLATQTVNGVPVLVKDSFVKSINLDNVFAIQLGVRYIFN